MIVIIRSLLRSVLEAVCRKEIILTVHWQCILFIILFTLDLQGQWAETDANEPNPIIKDIYQNIKNYTKIVKIYLHKT